MNNVALTAARRQRAAGRLIHRLEVGPAVCRVVTELDPVARVRARGGHVPEQDDNDPDREFRCETVALERYKELNFDPETGELTDGTENDADRPGARGRRIRGFSARSRARMMYRIATLDWSEPRGVPEMVTLTYPGEFPCDGETVKRHLHNFRRAWAHKWGQPRGVWKMEFQHRGAPHFHLYVFRPVMPWREFLAWCRETWHRIVTGCGGDCEHAHATQGVRLDRQFTSAARSARKLAGYFAKHNAKHSKHFQNEVPEGFEHCGRFWGVWGMTPQVVSIEVDTQSFVELRRLLLRAQRVRGRKRRAPSRLIGLWSLVHDGPTLAARMLTWLGQPPAVRLLPATVPL